MIARHTEEKANRRTAGETAPTVYVEIVVTVAEPKHVDELVEFMNEHATGWVDWNKYDGTNRNVNGAIGRIDLDLVPTVEAMPGVIEIYEVIPARHGSQLQQGVPTLEPAEVLGADTWQAVGINGTGTEVGIIDYDFRNLDAHERRHQTRIEVPLLRLQWHPDSNELRRLRNTSTRRSRYPSTKPTWYRSRQSVS